MTTLVISAFLFTAVPGAGADVALFWASSPVQPGQTALLCGHFSDPAGLTIDVARERDAGRKSSRPSTTPAPFPASAQRVKPVYASDTAVMFEVPDLGGPGVYRVRLRHKAERKPLAEARLNAPEVWWLLGNAGRDITSQEAVSPDALVYATPGGWVRIVGRCLAFPASKTRVILRGKDASGRAKTFGLQVRKVGSRERLVLGGSTGKGAGSNARGEDGSASSPSGPSLWTILARVPKNIPIGLEGRVFVYNGYGPADCWADSGGYRVRIIPATPEPPQLYLLRPPQAPRPDQRRPFPGTPVTYIDARDFGADGDDTGDDTLAVQQALEKAATVPGVAVVKLPRGRIFLTEPLTIPPHVLLRGEGQELTALTVPDTDEPPTAWIQGTHHFGLADFTFYCSYHKHIIAGDMSGDPTKSGHVYLHRVRVRGDSYRGHLKPEQVDERFRASLKWSTGGGDTVRFSGPDIVITDCDLYGSGRSLYCFEANGALIARNKLYNGRWGWYNLNVCRDVVFEDCDLVGGDLMSTGGGYACFGPLTRSENILTRHNTYSLMHGWDREAFTSDAGGGAYFGTFKASAGPAGSLDVELTEDARWGSRPWKGSLFAVIAGAGRGFVGRVVAYDGRKVVVAPLPSVSVRNYALVKPADWARLFDDTSQATITPMHRRYIFEGDDFSDAGIGIQYYGTAIEHVATGNSTRRAGGFHGLGITYAGGTQPDMYCQWLGNEILEGNSYRFGANNAQAAGPSHLGIFGRSPSLNFGAVVRGNHLHNNARLEVTSQGSQAAVENVLIEGNIVERSDVGLRVRDGRGVVYRQNTFRDCRKGVRDAAAEMVRWRQAVAMVAKTGRPLAWWSFDKLAGKARVAAQSPEDMDFTATFVGSCKLAPGKQGQALSLDGKSYAEVTSDSACFGLNLTDFTLSVWINPAKVKGRWGIVSKRTRHAETPCVVAIRDGHIVFEATDAAGKWTTYNFTSPPVLKPNQWQHIAVTVEEGKKVTLYYNGTPVATNEIHGQKIAHNEFPLRIGWEAWGGDPAKADTPGYFTGLIDELKIWPRVLTAAEIAREAQ